LSLNENFLAPVINVLISFSILSLISDRLLLLLDRLLGLLDFLSLIKAYAFFFASSARLARSSNLFNPSVTFLDAYFAVFSMDLRYFLEDLSLGVLVVRGPYSLLKGDLRY